MKRISGKVIGVISAKGGVGKTTTSINLASQLSLRSLDSIYVDCDFQSSNSMAYLGIPFNSNTIHGFLNNQYNLDETKYLHPSGIRVIPGSINYFQARNVNLERLNNAIKRLKEDHEVIFVDIGSNLNESLEIIKSCDGVIVVTDPYMASITDGIKTIEMAKENKKEVLGILVNKVIPEHFQLTVNNIQDVMGEKIIGVVNESPLIRQAQYIKQPLPFALPDNEVAKTYKESSLHIEEWLTKE